MESTPEVSKHDDKRTDLNRLLIRLDSDTTLAWEKYRGIRSRLVKFFEWNQCSFPEELADEVLDRIARKPLEEEIRDISEFVIGVARYLRLEAHKKEQRESHLEDRLGGEDSVADPRDHESELLRKIDHQSSLGCLRDCLAGLNSADSRLALDYYSAEEEKQKVHRQKLASAAGINMVALRVRANRVRGKLELCVSNCVESRRNMRPQENGAPRL